MDFAGSDPDDFEVIDYDEASLGPEDLAKVQKWLHPTNYIADSSEFCRHLSSQAPGTGMWICNTSQFQQWHESDHHSSLWIKGVPGAGKSVIAASMIEHLKKANAVPVLFFFFRYIVAANRRPRGLIQDFLSQLLPYSLRLQATLHPLIGGESDDLSDERLWDILLIGLSSVEKAYCIVDAMDEMELAPTDSFLTRLNSLSSFRPKSVKILMTSRPKQYLQSSLRDASIVHISLEDDLVGKDIALFVSHRLKITLPHDDQKMLRDSLESMVCERSRGLFLYARLLLDQIDPMLQSAQQLDVEILASTLPIGLEEMYNNMLFQQAETMNIDISIQVFLLELATHASRPLRLNELANILESVFSPSELPGTPKSIARLACSPLLEILEDETVQVIHHSFTEFLLDDRRTDPAISKGDEGKQFPVLKHEQVHKKVTLTCLDYLQSGVLSPNNSGPGKEPGICECIEKDDCACDKEPYPYDYQDARLRYPFLEYAVTNWAYHAGKYDVGDNEFFKSIDQFLDPESLNFQTWLRLEWIPQKTSSAIKSPSALHIAAFAGLSCSASTLLRNGQDVDSRDAVDRTPLHWACRRGHIEVVSVLLKNTANPDAEDHQGVKPLHEAAKKNHAAIVQKLLEAGVDPLTPKTRENHKGRLLGGEISTKGENAIEYVCLQGHTESILVMLPFLRSETLEQVLCESCRYGKYEAARAVLESTNVSPDATFCGATALYLASQAHSVDCVKLLLAKGADVHKTSIWSPVYRRCGGGSYTSPERTPLLAVVSCWKGDNDSACQKILRMLLKAGADIESRDGKGDTPLLSLFPSRNDHRGESREALKCLLEAGADVSAVDYQGDAVILRAFAKLPCMGTVKLLLDHGADISTRGSKGDTVLHLALSGNSYRTSGSSSLSEIVQFLLERGASSDVKNSHGYTALGYAILHGHCSLETFKLLLQACPDEAVRRRCLWSLGSRKDQEETKQFIQELLANGLSLETPDSDGRTVLLAHVQHQFAFHALLQCGAKLDAVDLRGRGVLHHFVLGSGNLQSLKMLRAFVGMGLNPLKVDNDGNNLLHEASRHYVGTSPNEADFIQQLLDYGIPVNDKNNLGLTPLHINIEMGRTGSWTRYQKHHESPRTPLLMVLQRAKEKLSVNAQDIDGVTPLHLAAMRFEPDIARLLKAGADPSVLTSNKRSALHLACRARKGNIVGYLLHEAPYLLNTKDAYGRTPLHDACASGRPESVYYLFKSGADITLKDNLGRTPLHSCAEFSTEQKLWSMPRGFDASAGQIPKDRYRPGSGSPGMEEPWYSSKWCSSPSFDEHETARIGGIVDSLLGAGADVYAKDTNNSTPLDLAIAFDCAEMMQLLKFSTENIQKAWGLDENDVRLQTVMALKPEKSLSNLDLPEPVRKEILRKPVRYMSYLNLKGIEWIAHNGGDLTGSDKSNPDRYSSESVLQEAAERGLTEVMAYLGYLAKVNDDPQVVLSRLIKNSDTEKVKCSIDYAAPTLHFACERELCNFEMLDLLVTKCGVDVNARSLALNSQYGQIKDAMEGPTALHCLAKARFWWQLEAIRFLVKNGADINSKNEKGETPLHIASSRNNSTANMGGYSSALGEFSGFWKPAALEILLDLGADPNVLDNEGLSCLHKASSSPECMKTLLQRGADISIGKVSPLFTAIDAHDFQALTIILDAGGDPNSKDVNKAFQVHFRVKNQTRWALFCASFSSPYGFNQQSQDSILVVKLLIERGANFYAPLNDRETLIHYIFEHAEYEIACAFLECSDKIDFNVRDQLGRSVFLAACNWNECLPGYRHRHWVSKETAPALKILDYGADPLAVDNEDRNALHHLLDNPDMEEDAILQFLRNDASKVLLKQKDGKGFSPLHCALRTLRPLVCEQLLEMGADLLEPDPDGATALHHIAKQCLRKHAPQRILHLTKDLGPEYYEGLSRLWQRYLDLGGDIDVRDNTGSPALFIYLSTGQRGETHQDKTKEQCCHVDNFNKFFKDADVHARNKDGENALHIIAKRGKDYPRKPEHERRLFEFMIEKGLDPLAEDGRSRSSLDIAAACEQKEILELFQYRS